MAGLSNEMIDVLTYIEQCWWETQQIPTNEKIHEETDVSLVSIQSYWKNDQFRVTLGAKGIKFDGKKDSKALTMQQLLVANMIMNTTDRRSMREKLKPFEIDPQTVNAWMRQPAFQEHLRKRAASIYENVDTQAYVGLVRAVESGDLKAIQLLFEMKGIYSPKLDLGMDIRVVVARVVEIISIHVKDPATLQLIADDIERVIAPPNLALPVGQKE